MQYVNLNKPGYNDQLDISEPGFYEDSNGKVFLALHNQDKDIEFYDLEQFVKTVPSYPIHLVTVVELRYK